MAATLIANDVDVDHPAIERKPANEIDDNTDNNSPWEASLTKVEAQLRKV